MGWKQGGEIHLNEIGPIGLGIKMDGRTILFGPCNDPRRVVFV